MPPLPCLLPEEQQLAYLHALGHLVRHESIPILKAPASGRGGPRLAPAVPFASANAPFVHRRPVSRPPHAGSGLDTTATRIPPSARLGGRLLARGIPTIPRGGPRPRCCPRPDRRPAAD